jgi:hypothetical protein
MNQSFKYAVLTGDLIKSSKMSNEQRQDTLSTISQLASHIPDIFPEIGITGPEIFRGDSWQLLLSQPQYALHVAAIIRAGLKSRKLLDTRIGIGLGNAEMLGNDLGQSDGAVFRLSGKALDELKRGDTLACKFEESTIFRESSELFLNSSLKFAARFMEDWSHLEAFAISRALEGKTHQYIAGEWPGGKTSQQNVTSALRRGGWPLLNNLLSAFSVAITIK